MTQCSAPRNAVGRILDREEPLTKTVARMSKQQAVADSGRSLIAADTIHDVRLVFGDLEHSSLCTWDAMFGPQRKSRLTWNSTTIHSKPQTGVTLSKCSDILLFSIFMTSRKIFWSKSSKNFSTIQISSHSHTTEPDRFGSP